MMEFEFVDMKNVIPFPKTKYGVIINCPEHVKLDATTYEDRIEFRGFNTITQKEIIRSFYFKEDESQGMSNLKKLTIVNRLVKEIQ